MNAIKKTAILYLSAISLMTPGAAQANETIGQSATNEQRAGQSQIYALGDFGPHGGKIFYLDASAKHGLEAFITDETHTLNWHDAVIAARKHGPGWRLPTISELEMLYAQHTIIGGFANDDYWSSTEQDQNSAWIQGFFLGDQDRYNKYSSLRVRAINEF